MNKPVFKYQEADIEQVFQKLIEDWDELTDFYNKEVKLDGEEPSERLAYIDIGAISRYIVDKKKSGQTENFSNFFQNIEEIMVHGDKYVQELIVIGLFEGIQNVGGSEIDYYRSFDKWLKLKSLNAWRELIDFWEKDDWRKTNEREKILKTKK